VVVLSNGTVEHRHVETIDDADDATVAAASVHLARGLFGASLGALDSLTLTGDNATDAVVASAMAVLRQVAVVEDAPFFVGGGSRLASAFDAVDIVHKVLLTLEQQYVVVGLVRDVLDRGLSVAIGAEHGVEPLAACSVVVAPFVVDGEHIGSVGVLGPTRMNYPQALAAVEIVSERLGRRLGDS
jgi:heat-inducible transcriptional repressor